jgi:hypothetical protein
VNLCRAVASTQSEKLLQELRGWRAAQLHLGYQKEEDRMRTAWQNRLVWALGVVVLVASVLMLWQKTQAQLEMPPAPGEVVAMQPPGQPVPPPPGPGQPFPGQPVPRYRGATRAGAGCDSGEQRLRVRGAGQYAVSILRQDAGAGQIHGTASSADTPARRRSGNTTPTAASASGVDCRIRGNRPHNLSGYHSLIN